MSKISKTTFTFTVLHRTDEQPTSLVQAMEEADTGDMVGAEKRTKTVGVADNLVAWELQQMGSDATFFEVDLNEGE